MSLFPHFFRWPRFAPEPRVDPLWFRCEIVHFLGLDILRIIFDDLSRIKSLSYVSLIVEENFWNFCSWNVLIGILMIFHHGRGKFWNLNFFHLLLIFRIDQNVYLKLWGILSGLWGILVGYTVWPESIHLDQDCLFNSIFYFTHFSLKPRLQKFLNSTLFILDSNKIFLTFCPL